MTPDPTQRPVPSRPSLADLIEAQRAEISKAMSIIEACRLGSDSMLAPMHSRDEEDDSEPDFEGALATAWTILDNACAALEGLTKEDRAATNTDE